MKKLFVLTLVALVGLTTAAIAREHFVIDRFTVGLSYTEAVPGIEFPRDFITCTVTIKNDGDAAGPFYMSVAPIDIATGRWAGSGEQRETGVLNRGESRTFRKTVWVYHDPDKTYRFRAFVGDWWGDLPNRHDEKTKDVTDRQLHMGRVRILRFPRAVRTPAIRGVPLR